MCLVRRPRTGRAPRGRAPAGLAVAWVLVLVAASPPVPGERVAMATDLWGDGAVTDASGFGVFGAAVEVTVWASSGIAAGPASLQAGPGGAYNWSFSQVPDGSLVNLTLRAWLPWDANVSVTAVFDLSNGSAPTAYPGVALALPFDAVESVVLAAPAGSVEVPRGRSVTVAVEVVVDGNVSVGHSG
ncbi:MAG TPA: hypothetical protein VGB42_01235, partial [Candidatus Thermoplasmatota archaeon]